MTDPIETPTDVQAEADEAPRRRKNRGGRPRSDSARTVVVGVRLTPDERDRLREIAGNGALGEVLRSRALGYRPRIPRQVPEINREAWIELARTASNLNQLAHSTNAGETVDPDELAGTLADCRRLLSEVRRLLVAGAHARPASDDNEVVDDGDR